MLNALHNRLCKRDAMFDNPIVIIMLLDCFGLG